MALKRYAVIVAGGSGTRMGGSIAKQFMMLADKPILLRTVETFLSLSPSVELIIVVPAALRDHWKELCRERKLTFRHTLVTGGITRFHSVKNALKYVEPGALVAVHDGVRPFATKEFIESMYEVAEEKGAVIPVVKVSDSLRELDQNGSHPVNRDNYIAVQTPQVFRSDLLLKAYNKAYSPVFTDDASVVESIGEKVHFADGLATNIKITKPEDMVLAQALLTSF